MLTALLEMLMKAQGAKGAIAQSMGASPELADVINKNKGPAFGSTKQAGLPDVPQFLGSKGNTGWGQPGLLTSMMRQPNQLNFRGF